MPLPSFFQRFRAQQAPVASPALSAADIEQARTKAKRRMVGMTVLVLLAVAVLSWLLETEPRQLPQDIRVVAAAASEPAVQVAAVLEPAPRPAMPERAPVAQASSAARVDAGLADGEEVVEASAPKPVVKPAPKPVEKPAEKPAQKPAEKPAAKPPVKPPVKPETKPPEPAKPIATRYVVQVGAFADVTAARATRLKVEGLGLKTYTQVVQTPAGRKIRVRLGPYTTEAEAQKALATVRKAGVVGGILTF